MCNLCSHLIDVETYMGAKNAPLLPNELVEAVDSAHGAVDSEVGDHAPNTKILRGKSSTSGRSEYGPRSVQREHGSCAS